MDDLFVVYRYLALNKHKSDETNAYNIAFQALDSYVDIEGEIAFYARMIRKTGGLGWDEAEKLTSHVLTGFETGLNNHHGTPVQAAINFCVKYISLDDIDTLIEACQVEKARMLREKESEQGNE